MIVKASSHKGAKIEDITPLLERRDEIQKEQKRLAAEIAKINLKLMAVAVSFGTKTGVGHLNYVFNGRLVQRQRRSSMCLDSNAAMQRLIEDHGEEALIEGGIIQSELFLSEENFKKAIEEKLLTPKAAQKYLEEKVSYALIVREVKPEEGEDA